MQTTQKTSPSAGSLIEAAQRQWGYGGGSAGSGDRDSLRPVVLRQLLEHSKRRARNEGKGSGSSGGSIVRTDLQGLLLGWAAEEGFVHRADARD